MIDPFVILAAVLLLAVVALLRFVGCATLAGIDDISYAPTATAPAPTITGFEPPDATVGDPDFPLTVKGSNFVPGLTVTFGNAPVTVLSVTPLLKVQIPRTAPELATPNTNPGVTVTVTNPGGGTASAPFTIQELVQVTFSGPEPTTPPAGPPAAPPGTAYKNLIFDANWAWERTTAENIRNHVYLVFNQAQGSFTFANGPRLLKSMKVSANPAGNITVSSDNNQNQDITPPQIPITTGQSVTVPINWTQKSTMVTVVFTALNSIGIDTISYEGPA